MKSRERELLDRIEELELKLQEAHDQLDAIKQGEVDALVISGPSGEQVYTLKEADRPYRTIIEEMSEGTVSLTDDGIVLFCNKQFARMLGSPLSRLLGSSVYDYLMPGDIHEIERILMPGEDDLARKAEVTFTCGPGGLTHTRVSFSPLLIDDSRIYCGVVTDITPEKVARDELQETNELLERLFESPHIMVAYLDKDLIFIRVNSAFASACKQPPEHFIGRSFSEIWPASQEEAMIKEVVEKGEPMQSVERHFECIKTIHKSMYADWNAQPVKGSDGKVEGVILTLIDRTKPKLLEKERLMLEKAVEQAGDGVIVTDPEGTIEYVNSASRQISGFGRHELIGRKLDLLQKDNVTFLHVRKSLAKDGLWKGRITATRKDGSRAEVEAMVAAVHDDDSSILNYIMIEHDVTNEIKLEQQVRQMQKMEALGRLAGGIAHDLNNILYPIIINTEMLLDEEGPGTTMHQPLRQILTAAYRQRDLVRQILAFSRRSEQKLKPLKIAPIIKESLKFLRASLPSTTEIRQDIQAEDEMVLGDPTQIHQIIMNLCSNAADAMDSQAGRIEVTLNQTYLDPAKARLDIKPGRYLQLTVSDTGHGMTHEVMEHIFEPFYTTKEASRGSGMGLAVVHGIVKSHRGSISVESKPGKGSRFVVYLPIIDETYQHQIEETGTDEKARPKDKKQILLIDDEGIVLSSVQRALERLGYQVTALKDAKEALNVFSKAPRDYDLVVTDQTMPRMTGAQLADEVMHIRPDIPVILCTGFSEVITEQEAKDMGIKELLMKPATTKDLGEAINRALRG